MAIAGGLVILGLFCVIAGLLQALIGVYEWRKDEELLREGKKTVATILGSVTYPDDESLQSGQHRLFAYFHDDAGVKRCAKSRFVATDPGQHLKREVVVVYDPRDPDRCRLEHDVSLRREVRENVAMVVLGLVCIVVGVIILAVA